MLRIAVDAMGGDHGPADVVAAVAAASLALDAELLLVGHERTLTSLLSEQEHNPERIAVYHAANAIGQFENAAKAMQAKRDSSIEVAVRLLADNLADTLVTMGNGDAVVEAARRHLRPIDGIARSARGAVYPTEVRRGEKQDPFVLLLDAGASMEADADELVSFAVMGSAYASCISRNERPRVALLSNGSDETRGLPSVVAAHQKLREMEGIHFVGNIAPIEIPRGTADVVVCAGFYGNLVLGMLHETHEAVLSMARYAHKERLMRNAGMWMLRSGLSRLKEVTDWHQYGGEPLLGYEKVIMIADGRSRMHAIVNAMKVAARAATCELPSTIRQNLQTEAP